MAAPTRTAAQIAADLRAEAGRLLRTADVLDPPRPRAGAGRGPRVPVTQHRLRRAADRARA